MRPILSSRLFKNPTYALLRSMKKPPRPIASSPLTQVSPHVYWLPPDPRTDRPSLGAVVGSKGTLLLDAGNSPAHITIMLDALAALHAPAPRYCVLTHWHWDHVFGAQALAIPLIAQRSTARELRKQASYDWSDEALDARVQNGLEIEFCAGMIKAEWPDRSDLRIVIPDILFDDGVTFDLGDARVDVAHVGGDHAADSSIVYIQDDRVLFLGDALYDAIYAPERYYTTEKLFPLLDRVLAYNAEWFIQGHHETVEKRLDLESWIDDVRHIGALVNRFRGNRASVVGELKIGQRRLSDKSNFEYIDTFIAGLGQTART